MIEEPDIDMKEFFLNVDQNAERMGDNGGSSVNVEDEEIEVLNNEILIPELSSDEGGGSVGSPEELKNKIKQHVVKTRREIVIIRNDKNRVRAVCKGSIPDLIEVGVGGPINKRKCLWVLYASNWSKDADREVHTLKMKVFRAKTKANIHVRGAYAGKYSIQRDYILELQTRNPYTTVKIKVETEPNPHCESRIFKRIYICLGSLKKGFAAGKRDYVDLDGSFLKGPYPGIVLTIVGLNGNNCTYPLAYTAVEAENINSWTWFLNYLGDDLNLHRRAHCDGLLNNLYESLNSQLQKAREQSIITCLEFIKEYLMCIGVFLWEWKWELTGIPCKHGLVTIWDMRKNNKDVGLLESWVHPTYRLKTWKEMYSFKIEPINGRRMWEKYPFPTTLLPLKHYVPIGRPKKKRKKSDVEDLIASGSAYDGGPSRKGKADGVGKKADGVGKKADGAGKKTNGDERKAVGARKKINGAGKKVFGVRKKTDSAGKKANGAGKKGKNVV
ncbi:unnamed protein product [Lactuca saligna]|uniref:MULE transposase domain-containing protein n=1 Tax=Lactuca saligna TaxID=75948 RepID=A0AA36EEE8_LACSI|nr:unnamed protein product [Lactuca saligna]